jgi:hypothetical protein
MPILRAIFLPDREDLLTFTGRFASEAACRLGQPDGRPANIDIFPMQC